MVAGPGVLGLVARGTGYETAFFTVAALLVLALGLLIPVSRYLSIGTAQAPLRIK